MNTLFNSALKQSSQLRSDLDSFAASPTSSPAVFQGQISATLTSFSRTIDDYAETSKKELNVSKQEKARERIKAFRSELSDYRERFESVKRSRDQAQTAQSRTELLGRRPHQVATPENPYASTSTTSTANNTSSQASQLFGNSSQRATAFGTPYGGGDGDGMDARESHALREQSFFAQGNAQLDEYLERGRAVLGDLSSQREMLKGTQRRLYDVAGTLGISGDTIRMVERRARQDRWIFWAGVVVFFLFCWLVLHYLR